MRTAARVDDNQKEIVAEFRKLGFSVLLIHQLKNCCDIIVSRDKFTAVIEIKDGKKPPSQRKLTAGEQEFKDRWLGRYYLCESIKDVHEIDRIESSIVKASKLILEDYV